MGNRWGNSGNSVRLFFFGSKITVDGDCSHEIRSCLLLGRKVITNLDSILKSRGITLPTKVRLVKAVVFQLSCMDARVGHQEGWALKNWCFRTLVLEKTLESPVDSKKIKPVNSTGNQPWIFIGRADAEAQILWPSDAKSWLIEKDPDPGKGQNRKETGVAKDEMVGRQSLIQRTWVCTKSERWWRTGKPGVLQSMGLKSWKQLCDWTATMERAGNFR